MGRDMTNRELDCGLLGEVFKNGELNYGLLGEGPVDLEHEITMAGVG